MVGKMRAGGLLCLMHELGNGGLDAAAQEAPMIGLHGMCPAWLGPRGPHAGVAGALL